MSELGASDATFDFELPALPYPGLRPFDTREWPIFFGRERMADEVVGRLQRQRLLVVHGDSGSGKSSLIRAGVLSRLEQEAARGGARWRTCIALPGSDPLWNLARALAGLDGRAEDGSRVIELRRVLNFGRDAAAALAPLLLRDALDHVCILIDQFEELFAHSRQNGPTEGRLIADFLIGLHDQRPPGLYAALTMRSEFLGPCAQFGGFAETVNRSQYLLPHMAPADLLRAIREPAKLYEGEVDLELAERLIADAGGGQDQLPLIQHGLMVLHRQQAAHSVDAQAMHWRLSLGLYSKSGGLQVLLSNHADEVAQRALSTLPAGIQAPRLVEDLFRALTEINPDGRALRRPQKFSRLVAVTASQPAALRHVIDSFRAEGVSFLRPYGAEPIDENAEIDISHEALIRCWDNLADPKDGWLAREFRNGMVWRSLLVQADSFERDPSSVLSPATTEEREVWLKRRNATWSERYGGGWERVVRLIETSVAEREQQKIEKETERQRAKDAELRIQRLRILGIWLSASIFFALVATATTIWALAKRREAEAARYMAEAAERASSAALARYQSEQDQKTRLVAELERSAANLRNVQAALDTAKPTNGAYSQTVIDNAQAALKNELQQLDRSTKQSLDRSYPLKGYTLDVFFCASDPENEKRAASLRPSVERLGGSARFKSLAEEKRNSPGYRISGNQIRVDSGSQAESELARSLMAEPEFAAAGKWDTVTVSRENATLRYLSVFVCSARENLKR